ncbi:hypothetical protein BGZ67_001225 [Mortierella alpina]|nr:hypothetical protein BGZ67_001225 [Mortierella alpina]
MNNQDSDETEDYDTVQLVREPLNMASIQSFEGRLLPRASPGGTTGQEESQESKESKESKDSEETKGITKESQASLESNPTAPKRQGVPIHVPQAERRPSNYKLETSNPALLTGFRVGGIIKRKPSISQQGQRALSPSFNGSRGDKHKIKKVAAPNDDDYELVGMVPGYANAHKDKPKTRALEYVLLSDEEEHKVSAIRASIKTCSDRTGSKNVSVYIFFKLRNCGIRVCQNTEGFSFTSNDTAVISGQALEHST